MRRRYQPGHDEIGQTSTNGVLFQVPDIGVRRGMLSAMLA